MEDLVRYSFNSNEIAFLKGTEGNGVMINATEMAKPFGKTPKDWLRTEQAQRMIGAISNRQKCTFADLQLVRNGSPENGGGTWFHEDVALVFAQWLAPEFYLWCNDRIKDLLTKGVATTSNDDEAILHAIQVLQKRVEDSKARQKELENHNAELEETIETNAPKVLFADTVACSNTSILVGELAKLIANKGVKIGQNRLFEWMRQNGYICKKNGIRNYPTQRSIELGVLEVVERTVSKPDGSSLAIFTVKVTGKGQIYFTEKLQKLNK